MSHSENDSCFFDCAFHFQAVARAGRHGFFAENMITLLCKRSRDFSMKVVLNSDDDGIC
jgi:hypothetical protein